MPFVEEKVDRGNNQIRPWNLVTVNNSIRGSSAIVLRDVLRLGVD